MRIRIKELRQKAQLTQKHVADELGISQPYFAQIERGERRLNAETQEKIARIIGVPPQSLIDFDAPSKRDEEFLLNCFRELDPARRQGWIDMAKTVLGRSPQDDE